MGPTLEKKKKRNAGTSERVDVGTPERWYDKAPERQNAGMLLIQSPSVRFCFCNMSISFFCDVGFVFYFCYVYVLLCFVFFFLRVCVFRSCVLNFVFFVALRLFYVDYPSRSSSGVFRF